MWTSADGFEPPHSTPKTRPKLNCCQLLSSVQRSLNQTCHIDKPECAKRTVANVCTEGTWEMIPMTSIQNLHSGSTVLWMFPFYFHKPPQILIKQLRWIDFMPKQNHVLIQAMHGAFEIRNVIISQAWSQKMAATSWSRPLRDHLPTTSKHFPK